MRLYELYSYEGDGMIRWPVTIGYFESEDLANRYRDMIREQRGTKYEVREAQNLDRAARRDPFRWERDKPHAARPAVAEGQGS